MEKRERKEGGGGGKSGGFWFFQPLSLFQSTSSPFFTKKKNTHSHARPLSPPLSLSLSPPPSLSRPNLPIQIVEAGAEVCCGGKATVDRQFDMAAAANLTVVRMFAFPVLEGFNLQTSAGKYNEKAAKGLDYVIAAAARRGLKLVIALANNWKYNNFNTDAKCAYTNWTKTAKGCDDFWTDKAAIKLYKKNSERITGRVNTLTGIAYKDDPTILAWNLINEPRCETPGCAPKLQSWIEDVSAHLKSVDPNHLITVGEDGFYQADNCWADIANPVPRNGYKNQGPPGSGWPLATGQDFVPNHAPSSIDFLSIHMWPGELWGKREGEGEGEGGRGRERERARVVFFWGGGVRAGR